MKSEPTDNKIQGKLNKLKSLCITENDFLSVSTMLN
jgi:hypothetical protein